MAKSAEETAQVMSSFVNNMNCGIDEFVKIMSRDHRTLQQTFTNLCFAWIRECSDKNETGNFDERNEHSVYKCAEIIDTIDLNSFRKEV